MGIDECLDLVSGLPDGSMFVSASAPSRSWSERRQLANDIMDTMSDIWQARCGVEPHERQRRPRPWDEELAKARDAAARAEYERAEAARNYIGNTKWESI